MSCGTVLNTIGGQVKSELKFALVEVPCFGAAEDASEMHRPLSVDEKFGCNICGEI